MHTRDALIDALSRSLREHDCIRAAWLGGSDANGRADPMSDIDVFFVHAPGRLDDAERAFDGSVASLGPVAIRYRVPEPAWHGGRQVFYQLKDAPEWLMIDWLALEQGKDHPWLERERHGTPQVLFDKDGDIRPKSIDRAAINAAIAKKIAELRVRFPLLRHLAPKQGDRGLPIDGAYFYQALVLRPLVDLLRCLHCPERHDYGFRYLRDELPRGLYERLCVLAYPRGPADLEPFTREARVLFEAALAEWDEKQESGDPQKTAGA